MQKILLLVLGCFLFTACGKNVDHKYLDGNPKLVTNCDEIGEYTKLAFWPPDIVPHPHPPIPPPKDPNEPDWA